MSERSRIALLKQRFSADLQPGVGRVRVGIGDDAAVLDPDGLVWTVDVQVEGTHFMPSWVSWEDIGWRSFMAAASDLAAMGAEPVAALSSLVLTPAMDDATLDALARGQAAASRAVGAPIVGGNLARGRETSITTTLLGRAVQPILRSGAQAGDGVWLAGPVGLASAGLALLVESREAEASSSFPSCLRAWRRPIARLEEGRALVGRAHAAIDVSDGLSHDAGQLAEASCVCIVLEEEALRRQVGDELAGVAALLGRDGFDFVLHGGGEDYALLATSAVPLPGFVRIGSVEAHDGDARLMLASARGRAPVSPRGFDHFSRD